MGFNENEKYYVITDYNYKQLLLKAKKNFPTIDIKFLSKNDVLDMLSFAVAEETIPYLLSLGQYDYSQIKKLLPILRIGNIPKDHCLYSLREDLKQKGYLTEDYLGVELMRKRKVLLFEAKEDRELSQFLKRKGISYQFIGFEDFNIKPYHDEKNPPSLYVYTDKFHQYMALFSDLYKRLLEDKDYEGKYQIRIKEEGDLYFVRYFSSLFAIPCVSLLSIPLLTQKGVKELLTAYYEKESFDVVLENAEEEAVKKLTSLIDTYRLKEVSDFKKAYASLIEIVSAQKQTVLYGEGGITIGSDFAFNGKETYITDFAHDTFYKTYDDNNILSDKELEEIEVNPSNVKTKMDRQLKLNYLKYQPILSASRVLLHLDDKIYDSQFLDELSWEMMVKKDFDMDGCYTKEAAHACLTYLKDENGDGQGENYKCFDHKFEGFKETTFTPNNENGYSVTSLKTYYECPFKYYLDKVIRVGNYDKERNEVASKRGNLVHKILEHVYKDEYKQDFDKTYEATFEEGRKAYLEKAKIKENTAEEEAYLVFIKKWLRDILKGLQDIQKKGGCGKIEEIPEQNIKFSFKNENGKEYHFNGIIDKILITQGEDTSYYTIVDYKTAKHDVFDYHEVFLGGSLQLPLYSLGLLQGDNILLIKSACFGGFGISHVYFKKPPYDAKSNYMYNYETIEKYTKITGIALEKMDYFNSIDKTAIVKSTNKQNEVSLSLRDSAALFRSTSLSFGGCGEDDYFELKKGQYRYQDLFSDAQNAAMRLVDGIEENDFAIRPSVLYSKDASQGNTPCRYCAYRDICYRDRDDYVIHEEEIERHFHLKGMVSEEGGEEDA